MRCLIMLLLAAAVNDPPQRIVSTSPAITEVLFALGLGGRVAGVSTYCHFPAEALTRPKVGTYLRPNLEAIARLDPGVVIGERFTPQAAALVRGRGAQLLEVKTGGLETNLRMIEAVGAATGASAAARKLVGAIEAGLAAVRERSRGATPRKVLFIVGRAPGRLEGMVAVGQGSYLNELLTIAGGRNLMADSAMAYPRLSLEAIVRLQPDVIIDMGDMSDTRQVSAEHVRAVEALWGGRSDVHARIHVVASDIFVVPGPRMVDAARAFAQMLHGAP